MALAAAGEVTIDSIGGPAATVGVPAGATANFEVSFTADTVVEDGTIEFSTGSSTITAVTSTADGVDCDGPTATCALTSGDLDDGTFDVVVTVKAPVSPGGDDTFYVSTSGDAAAWDDSDDVTFDIIDNGDSELDVSFGDETPAIGAVNKWVAVGSTYSVPVTVQNHGSGPANFVSLSVDVNGSASVLSPVPPAFAPTISMVGGSCAVTSSSAGSIDCTIASIASGASATFTVNVGGLTHLGSTSLDAWVTGKADTTDDVNEYDYTAIRVTDGTLQRPRVAITSPHVAAGGTAVVYDGEITNSGSAVLNGYLDLYASGFDASGNQYDGAHGPELQSIQSASIGGAACAAVSNGGPAEVNWFRCPVSGLAVGARVTFTLTAVFPTSKPDMWGSVWTDLNIAGYPDNGAVTDPYATTALNPSKTRDLQVSLASSPFIGADRVNPLTVTVKNAGNTKAEGVTLTGEIRGVGGTFDVATLPGSCTGVTKPQFANCYLGDIEAGTTTSITLNVRGGKKLGDLVAIFRVSGGGEGFNVNPDDDTLTQVLEVKKASAIVLTGVTFGKPKKQNITQLTKSGVSTVVTCKVACKAKSELRIARAAAIKLGLVKAPKKGKKPVKQSPFITVGTGTKSIKGAGKLTVVAKLSRAYKTKIGKLTKNVVITRVVTVTSTEAGTKDASVQKSQNLTFKPAKKKPVKKPKH